jgi:hypothetical protein
MRFSAIRYEVEDALEGIPAFLEKRPARFTLRPSADLLPFYPWWRSRPFAAPGD